jgi:hypothetical protein
MSQAIEIPLEGFRFGKHFPYPKPGCTGFGVLQLINQPKGVVDPFPLLAEIQLDHRQ